MDWSAGDLVNLGLRLEWVPEGRRCPPRYAGLYDCSEDVLVSQMPQSQTYRSVDRSEIVRVWRLYASAGLGSKPGVAAWLGAGLLGLMAAAIGDCCSAAW